MKQKNTQIILGTATEYEGRTYHQYTDYECARCDSELRAEYNPPFYTKIKEKIRNHNFRNLVIIGVLASQNRSKTVPKTSRDMQLLIPKRWRDLAKLDFQTTKPIKLLFLVAEGGWP